MGKGKMTNFPQIKSNVHNLILQINLSFNSKGERVAFTLSPVYNISPYKQSGFSLLLQSCEKEIDIELFAGVPLTT